ncbi:hypothetical protein EAX61_08850 [Dokdonia sinensis]|uniref:Uncharacterized protein n=1 Tax=Dokdonia sinensis TaxID=2479847 RepID=A0A3M0G523_9FLAO|nr:hypothetical protein [Dokdonia sinensis]RMB59157.1 hypothetical protein EAX61_08850 [Dokdonia sinensis]
MELIFIIAIVFFACVVIALHLAAMKMYGKSISKKERKNGMFYHWNWLLLIGGLSTALLIGVLKWTGILGLV